MTTKTGRTPVSGLPIFPTFRPLEFRPHVKHDAAKQLFQEKWSPDDLAAAKAAPVLRPLVNGRAGPRSMYLFQV